jgi:hypothetical protein
VKEKTTQKDSSNSQRTAIIANFQKGVEDPDHESIPNTKKIGLLKLGKRIEKSGKNQ